MKRWILGLILFGAAAAVWATTQANSIGIVRAILENKTLGQINLYGPLSTGQLVYCSDCAVPVGVSTGTGTGAWTTLASSSTHIN